MGEVDDRVSADLFGPQCPSLGQVKIEFAGRRSLGPEKASGQGGGADHLDEVCPVREADYLQLGPCSEDQRMVLVYAEQLWVIAHWEFRAVFGRIGAVDKGVALKVSLGHGTVILGPGRASEIVRIHDPYTGADLDEVGREFPRIVDLAFDAAPGLPDLSAFEVEDFGMKFMAVHQNVLSRNSKFNGDLDRNFL